MSETVPQNSHAPAQNTSQASPQTTAQTPHESEAILHSFYESAPMIMGVVEVWDDDILHLSGNAAAARFMGATPESMKFRLASAMGVPHERIREWISRYQATISAKMPIRFEYQSPAAQGARWMAATVSFIAYTEAGNARCSYIIEDITVQKQALLDQQVVSALHEQRARLALEAARMAQTAQAETAQKQAAQQALRDSEQQLRLVMDAAPVLISYIDAHHHYRFNNKAYADWLNQPQEHINGRHVVEVIGQAAYQAAREQIEAALNGQSVVYEREMRYHGVEPRFVHSEFVPDRDAQGEVKGFVAVVSDITESKRQQDALRESERRYRFMAEAIPQIVWTADAEGGLDYYNRRWTEYTGLTLEQTINGGLLEIFYPDDLAPSFDAWWEALRTGHPYAMEHRIRGTDGLYRWFLTRAVAMRDGDDRIVKWFGTATDIDAQKRASERERLLGSLGERLRATNDPQEVLWVAVSMVGEHLQTSRCYYTDTDVDADKAVVHRDYCRGVESWAGTYKLSDFGGDVLVELGQGKTVSIADTKTDPRTAAHYETTYLPTNIRAYLAVPLMQNGKRVASLVVNHSGEPRAWTAEEVSLLETVAERTRMSVENARLWQAERERSQQLTLAIAEVHHRVKNSLQGVSALLEMQLPFDSDMMPVQTVREGLNQIKTIALVHDLLARDRPIGDVDAAQVLTKLVELLSAGMKTAERPAPIRVQAEKVWIPTKAATALALTVNELVSNAEKHSRALNREDLNSHDAIEVRLTQQNGTVRVSVQDSGPGFLPNFNPNVHANIGLELVLTLVRHDLHGSITFSNRADLEENAGTRGGYVEIVFAEDVPTE